MGSEKNMTTEDKKIYLLLMHTKTIPSKIVKLFTRYAYSHVAIALDKDCETVYSFGRRKLNSILNGGFSVEKREGAFFEKFNQTDCIIYESNVSKKQYDNLEMTLDDMQKNIEEYKYDFIGIVPRFFGIPFTIKNRYVCSYFIASLLEENGIYKFEKPACLTKPKDFENLNGFKEIYRGKVLEWKC